MLKFKIHKFTITNSQTHKFTNSQFTNYKLTIHKLTIQKLTIANSQFTNSQLSLLAGLTTIKELEGERLIL